MSDLKVRPPKSACPVRNEGWGLAAVMSDLKVRPPEEKSRVKTRLDNLGTEPEFVHDLIFRIG
jgi:hypothetical protein